MSVRKKQTETSEEAVVACFGNISEWQMFLYNWSKRKQKCKDLHEKYFEKRTIINVRNFSPTSKHNLRIISLFSASYLLIFEWYTEQEKSKFTSVYSPVE